MPLSHFGHHRLESPSAQFPHGFVEALNYLLTTCASAPSYHQHSTYMSLQHCIQPRISINVVTIWEGCEMARSANFEGVCAGFGGGSSIDFEL